MGGTSAGDAWERGAPYERYIGRWSRATAPRFLAWLGLPQQLDWLDVGCGTGALSAAVLDHVAPATVTAIEPSDGFRDSAIANLAGRARVLNGSACAIPLADASVDVVASGLVLNFVADPAAGLAEMRRVTRAGGTIAAYVWDYGERMQMLRAFWDAAVALDAAAVALDEGTRFPLCRADALRSLFDSAGLGHVEVAPLEVPTRFPDFAALWEPFLGGQGPAPAYVASLGEPARARLREAVRVRVPVGADGSLSLVARAWAVRGRA